MNIDQFLTDFPLLAEAPNGIPKLRELILQLAVQGKLVPQNFNDEPASVLLEKIKTEKERLVSEGEIGKQKPLPAIQQADLPYKVPSGWEWIKIGNATQMLNGRAFKPSEWSDNGLPIIRIQNLNNPNAPFNHCDLEIDLRYHINSGDFLISWSGTPGTSFGAFVWEGGHSLLNQHIFKCVLYGGFTRRFLKMAINAELDEMIAQAHGGVGLRHITKGKLENMLITLSPINEQHRIVAKVDELMKRCDDLESQQKERKSVSISLNGASLHALTTPQSPKHFSDAAQRIFDNFGLLYDNPENVKELRNTILQLAVQGKLVPQDPNDEPASVLLGKIKAEKVRLIAEGKIKKQKPLSPIMDNEVPYELSEGWEWARMNSICTQITDGAHHTPTYTESGVPFLSVKDISGGTLDFDNTRFISQQEHSELIRRCHSEYGNILLTKVGTTGIAKVIDVRKEFSIFVSLALLKFPQELLDGRYLEYLINAPVVKEQSAKNTQGVGNQNLVLRLIKMFHIPIPPLAEQKRIVVKVAELMGLCDELKQGLVQANGDAERLMEAVVYEMGGGA